MISTLLVALILIVLTATQIIIVYSFGATTTKMKYRVLRLERSQIKLSDEIHKTATNLQKTARKYCSRTPKIIEGNMDLIANDKKATVDVVFRTKNTR